MKYLYLIRHAKSSWNYANIKDIDRPLNDRGYQDAVFMGKILSDKEVQPDLIISSPAVRAYTTAQIISRNIQYPIQNIQIQPDIYDSYIEDIMKLTTELDDKLNTVFLFGHNPTWTNLVNFFSNDYIPNVPTCGIVAIELTINSWKEVNRVNGEVKGFYYPKLYKTK